MTINGFNNANQTTVYVTPGSSASAVSKSCCAAPSVFGYSSPYGNPFYQPQPYGQPQPCVQPQGAFGGVPHYPDAFGSSPYYTNSLIPYDVPLPFLNGVVGATRQVDLGMLTAQGSQSIYYNANARNQYWDAAVNGRGPYYA